MPDIPTLRFIPFRCVDVMQMCSAELAARPASAAALASANEQVEDYFQREFHSIKQQMKHAYGPLDPDADRCFSPTPGWVCG